MPVESPGLNARQELSRMGAVSPPMFETGHAMEMCVRDHEVKPFGGRRLKNGDPGAIRTRGPQIRNLMLYPAELRSHSTPQ